jgi:hypothetical protein
MKKTFEVTSFVELEYNENSTEFKESLASYKNVIYSKATARDMINNVVLNLVKNGHERIIEGVGYVKYNGECKDNSMFCGITLLNEIEPDFFL